MVTRLELLFRDRSGKIGRCGLWMPDTLDISDVLSAANLLRSALLPVTNASLVSAEWSHDVRFTDAAEASPEADVRRRLIAIFRDTEEWASVSVPSPVQLPLDATGPYLGVRLQRRSILLSPLLAALENIAANTLDAVGRPLPANFYVGGVTRL